MIFFKKDSFFYLALTFIFLVLLFVVLSAQTTYDLGDGVQHYLISKFSFAHPGLFFDHWGKPFFTLLSSPFAQLGMKGMSFFNILCYLISAVAGCRIAQKLQLRYNWLVAFFIAFAPMWFVCMNSGLTEPLFATILMICILLILEDKIALSLLLLSFLPFVRNEGVLFFPLFYLILIQRKKTFYTPLFLAGFIIYSLVGGIYFKDYLWVFNKMPYGNSEDIYGKLSVLHYVKNSPYIFGWIVSALIISGFYWIVSGLLSKAQKSKSPFLVEETILVYGCFVIYFLAHSVFAVYGSFGLLRILAGIVPLGALIALRGFNFWAGFFEKDRLLKNVVISVVLVLIIIPPFRQFWPFPAKGEQIVINKMGDWINSTELKKNKIYYLHPYITLKLDLDPFDTNKTAQLWGIDPNNMEANVPNGSIVIWDAHFGPNECHLPLDNFLKNPHYKLLQTFKPDQEFFGLGGYPFEIYIFQKV
jgi:hypothetical protein